jgi:hypothetical protein
MLGSPFVRVLYRLARLPGGLFEEDFYLGVFLALLRELVFSVLGPDTTVQQPD